MSTLRSPSDELGAVLPEPELLRAIVDKVSAMLAYWDSNLRCRFANRAYERWFGVTPESLIGKHISDLLGPLYPLNLPYIEGALRGELQEFEREIPDPSGGPSRHSLANYIPDVVDGEVRGFFVLVTDISAIKRAESALRESEERFRLTIEEAPIGMALIAPDGHFVRVNRVLCEIVGYTAEELTALTFQAITHPEDLDAALALADRLARGEIPRYQLETRYVRKDGTIVDIMLSGSALKDRAGAPLYFIAQIEDITERKRAQEERRQSQERFELALEGADLASWDWNIETGEVIFNRRWAEMRGFRPEEIRPHVDSWISGVHGDDIPRVQAALQAYFEGGSPDYETEHRVRTKSGQWLWVLDRGKIFARDEQGRPVRMVGTELDITERKRLQDEQTFLTDVATILASSLDFEETLTGIARLAVGRLADCVIVDVVQNADEVRRVLVVHADPAKGSLSEKLQGLRLDRRRPHLASALFETKQPTMLSEISPHYIESVAQGDEHLRILCELNPQSMMTVPLLARERLIGGLLLISTLPARRYGPRDLELAKELARRAALALDNARLYETARRATQMRDDVLGIVAHDLRNPLGTILMQVGLLHVRAADPEPQSRKAIEAIERAAARMNHLIEDLLDVTSMEAGRLPVKKHRVPAGQVLSDCLDAQQPLAASASLTLRRDAAMDLPEVWADRQRLLQVFENLIGNAVKFTGAGGVVTVGALPREGEVLFWVADTGTGITAEQLPHVFDRFWQARKGERRDAGLGLPIVKGIVEAHGGRIWVESAFGQGTTFFFTVPTAQSAEKWPSAHVQHGA